MYINLHCCRIFFILIVLVYNSSAQNLLTIESNADLNEITIFPPIDEFANFIYPKNIKLDENGEFKINLPKGFNKVIALIIK
mgnify:CR=1 FL=1